FDPVRHNSTKKNYFRFRNATHVQTHASFENSYPCPNLSPILLSLLYFTVNYLSLSSLFRTILYLAIWMHQQFYHLRKTKSPRHIDSSLIALAAQVEGFGRLAIGGLHGPLYHVTTLADDEPGSLRQGCRQKEPLWIGFEVSSTIHLLLT
ncbi:hypothetical protein IFM89_038409, partial [Coptis chinensis]